MNREIHWDLLSKRLILLVVCVAISVVLIVFSSLRYSAVTSAYENERRQFNKYARDYQSAIQEEKLYKAYVERFEQFEQKGYIGKEQRLMWIEVIQDINRTLKLPVLKYNIRARDSFELVNSGIAVDPNVALYESVMTLDLGLLHTGDLYVFFSELEKRAKGLFEIRGCDLQRVTGPLRSNARQANVNAKCLLSWYTVQVRKEQGND